MILQPMPYPSSAYPDYFYGEEIGSDTTSASVDTTVFTLSIPAASFEPNATYLIIWSAEVSTSALGVGGLMKCKVNSAERGQTNLATNDNTPATHNPAGGFSYWQPGASPIDLDIDLSVLRGPLTGSVTVRNKKITVLKLGPDDVFVSDFSANSTTSLAFVDQATLTFTPPSVGNYLFLASCAYRNSNGAVRTIIQLVGDTSTHEFSRTPETSTTEWIPFVIAFRLNSLAAASKTVKFTMATSNSSETASIDSQMIVAIRLDRFANCYSTALAADNTGTQATMTTALSQTFTPQAGKHLTIAPFGIEGSDTSLSVSGRFSDGGVAKGDVTLEPNSATSGRAYIAALTQNLATYAASSRTQAIQRQSETTATTTRIKKASAIHCLDLTGLVEG